MGKGRFVNQKLGKRVSRRMDIEKARLQNRGAKVFPGAASPRAPKKGPSREQHPAG